MSERCSLAPPPPHCTCGVHAPYIHGVRRGARRVAGLQSLARHLGFGPTSLGHNHASTLGASKTSLGNLLANETIGHLREVYARDLELLQYPQ